MEKFHLNIPIIRHFDDIDDLLNFGRDGDLIPGQEEKATLIAREIFEETIKEGKSAIVFICSSKKRGIQTAELIANEIRNLDDNMKIRMVNEDGLTSVYQGEFVLPSDYKAGDSFEGLAIANKVFNQETFSSKNFLYKFGDPVLQEDGSSKYPEPAPYFKSYGETNRDLLLRIYELIIKTAEKFEKLNINTKVVVITHAQLYQMFKDLSAVAEMIKNDNLEFKTGDLPKLCWELYSERFKRERPTYEINYISIDSLCNQKIIELLKKEIEFLKKLK